MKVCVNMSEIDSDALNNKTVPMIQIDAGR